MKKVCDKYGALFILDEVMSGMGRMGTLHAWESFGDGVHPDIQAIAKGLGGGYTPIGAVLLNERVSSIRDKSGVWKHGHTYQAHPVGCAAALAVQKAIQTENMLENARTRAIQLEELLRTKLMGPNAPSKPYVADIRGGGLFWGIEFELDDAAQAKLDDSNNNSGGSGNNRFGGVVQEIAFNNGLVIIGMSGTIDGVKGEHAILAPPLNVTPEEIEKIVDLFVNSVEEACKLLA